MSSEETAGLPDAVLKCVSDLFAGVNFRISDALRTAEQAHVQALHEALVVVRDGVRRDLSDEVRLEFDEKFKEALGVAKEQFRKKFDEKAAEMESERSGSRAELLEFRQRIGHVAAELTSKEAELAHLNRETSAMIEDPDVEISKIIRNNAALTELKSYIRGLQFQVGSSAKKAE